MSVVWMRMCESNPKFFIASWIAHKIIIYSNNIKSLFLYHDTEILKNETLKCFQHHYQHHYCLLAFWLFLAFDIFRANFFPYEENFWNLGCKKWLFIVKNVLMIGKISLFQEGGGWPSPLENSRGSSPPPGINSPQHPPP